MLSDDRVFLRRVLAYATLTPPLDTADRHLGGCHLYPSASVRVSDRPGAVGCLLRIRLCFRDGPETRAPPVVLDGSGSWCAPAVAGNSSCCAEGMGV